MTDTPLDAQAVTDAALVVHLLAAETHRRADIEAALAGQ